MHWFLTASAIFMAMFRVGAIKTSACIFAFLSNDTISYLQHRTEALPVSQQRGGVSQDPGDAPRKSLQKQTVAIHTFSRACSTELRHSRSASSAGASLRILAARPASPAPNTSCRAPRTSPRPTRSTAASASAPEIKKSNFLCENVSPSK